MEILLGCSTPPDLYETHRPNQNVDICKHSVTSWCQVIYCAPRMYDEFTW